MRGRLAFGSSPRPTSMSVRSNKAGYRNGLTLQVKPTFPGPGRGLARRPIRAPSRHTLPVDEDRLVVPEHHDALTPTVGDDHGVPTQGHPDDPAREVGAR